MTRLLLLTPARDESKHLDRVAGAVKAQTRRPDLWVIVDDGSVDDTPRLLDALAATTDFVKILEAPRSAPDGRDGLALASEARAFNWALRSVDLGDFTHIGKLDADVELPRDYFERLLAHFAAHSRLGISGGALLERGRKGWERTPVPDNHVRGALKLYSRSCFEAIGGIEERLAWDTIDETYARMNGYEAHSLPDLTAKHLRPVATAQGALRGRARHGQCAYILRYPAWWVAMRSLKVARARPVGLTGLAFLYGYLRSRFTHADRVEDEQFRRFVVRELLARIRRALSPLSHEPLSAESEAESSPSFVRS